MKKLTFLLWLGFPFFVSAQVDTAAVVWEVDSLIQVSRNLAEQKEFDKALDINVVAEKLALEKLDSLTVAYGRCCSNHGRLLFLKKDFPGAEKWCLNSKIIFEKVVGKEHPEYVKNLNNLANTYWQMNDLEKAEPLYLETKAIREKTLGKEHPDYASSLYNLANLYLKTGNYEKAEPLHLEAIAIREKTLGKEHSQYAGSLNNLAVLYKEMGSYEKAELLFLEAIAIKAKTIGKETTEYANSLNNLAVLYKEMSSYEKAEPLYAESKVIYEKVVGKEHSNYAASLNNLASLYKLMGNYEKAEPLYLEAKLAREKTLGNKHPQYAWSLHNLANLYRNMGNYEKAELLHLEAKSIREQTLEKDHPDYVAGMSSLANTYLNMRQYDKAEAIFMEAINVQEKTIGKEHPTYASKLNNLAILYFEKGSYEKAESLFLEAKLIWQKTLGNAHPNYGESLQNLASTYEIQNRFTDSQALQKEYLELTKSHLSRSTTFLSERELFNYVATFQANGSYLHSWMLARLGKSGQTGILPTLGYNHALFQKGFLLIAATRLNLIASASPQTAELNNQLNGFRRRLAAEYAKPLAERKKVPDLEEKANALEKDLARTVAGYGEALRQITWQEVQAALPPDAAAIEFVHFNYNFPEPTDSVMYAALVLRPGWEAPRWVPLFEEKQLEALLETEPGEQAQALNQLYASPRLHELLWQPLEIVLGFPSGGGGKVRTIYFSPSGLLHRLNLGAVINTSGERVSDKFKLVQLGSTRQLVVGSWQSAGGSEQVAGSNLQAAIFGGVRYEADSAAISQANAGIPGGEEFVDGMRGGLSFSQTDSLLRSGDWKYLKWTEVEALAVEKLLKINGLQPNLRKGFAASEEAFKAVGSPSPRILHVATHGFFFPDPKNLPLSSQERGLGGEVTFKLSEHPMIRSGLILAGGNHAWKSGKPLRPGMEDGILTAYEISQMNLSGTELVVLSACETGLGEIQGNEGVYGLQRAFKIAGAKYVLMSLWQVPDFQTQEMMTAFYANWLEGKMDIPDAFNATQAEMRRRYPEPFFWAGFVLVE